MEHSFDINIAKEYGITEAILLKNIYFWVKKNALNKTSAYDGRYWTYNSVRSFAGLFPYLNERQIKYALKKLRDRELIAVGNFNSDKRNRKLWYTLTDKALTLLGERLEDFIAGDDSVDDADLHNAKDKIVQCKEQNCTTALDKNVKTDDTKLSAPLDKIVQCTYTDINADVNGDSNITACAREQTGDGEAVNRLKSGEVGEGLAIWQNNFGTLSPVLAEKVIDLIMSVGIIAFKKAVEYAIVRNKRTFAYIRTVAEGIAAGDDWGDKPPEHKRQGGRTRNKNDVIATTAEAQRILESGELIDL